MTVFAFQISIQGVVMTDNEETGTVFCEGCNAAHSGDKVTIFHDSKGDPWCDKSAGAKWLFPCDGCSVLVHTGDALGHHTEHLCSDCFDGSLSSLPARLEAARAALDALHDSLTKMVEHSEAGSRMAERFVNWDAWGDAAEGLDSAMGKAVKLIETTKSSD